MNSSEIANLISGDVGDKFKISVKRGDETKDFEVELDKIEIKSVFSEIKEVNGKKIGYININNFASNTYKQFKSVLKDVEKNNIDSLIIDVRNNTGGHLSQVKNILSVFFDKKTVLFQIQNKKKTTKYYGSGDNKKTYPVVVLVNGGSASASEVLASCFKDNYKDATLVGVTTYGKGTVQQTKSLSEGSSFKFTTEKWLTSKGDWINEKGIEPDVVVENDPESDVDAQLDKAIELLSK